MKTWGLSDVVSPNPNSNLFSLFGFLGSAHHGGSSVADEGRSGAQGPFLFDTRRIQTEGHQVEGGQDAQVHPHDQGPPY